MTPEEQAQMIAMLRQILSQGGTNAPAVDLSGSLYPSLGKKVGDTNYYQDRVQMLGDPFAGAMAGNGAYDERAFMPTMERTSVEAPGRAVAQMWSQAPEGSAARVMYDLMMVDGMDVNTAWRNVKSIAEAAPDGVLALSLPPDQIDQYGDDQPGSGLYSLYEQANKMRTDQATDPAGAQYDPATGGFYTESEMPSALAQQFIEMGLPLPTERYEADSGAVTDFFNTEGAGYQPGLAEMGAPAGLSADSAAMNRAMAALGDREVTSRAPSPYPQFGDAGILDQQAIDRLKSSDQKAGDRWAGAGSDLGSFGISPVEQERLDVRERDAGEVELPETMKTNIASLRDPELDAWQRSTGMPINYDPIRRQTLNAYAGDRGQKREYDPITRRSSPVNQERRDLQAQINQGVRDRRKIRMANSVDGATGAGIGYGARKAANEQGRTPFTDAMAQRMIMQQLSGF